MKPDIQAFARSSSPAPNPNSRTRLASTASADSPSAIRPSCTVALKLNVSTVWLSESPPAPAPRNFASGFRASSVNRSPIMYSMSRWTRPRR